MRLRREFANFVLLVATAPVVAGPVTQLDVAQPASDLLGAMIVAESETCDPYGWADLARTPLALIELGETDLSDSSTFAGLRVDWQSTSSEFAVLKSVLAEVVITPGSTTFAIPSISDQLSLGSDVQSQPFVPGERAYSPPPPSQSVPLPGAASLGIFGLLVMGARRRRAGAL